MQLHWLKIIALNLALTLVSQAADALPATFTSADPNAKTVEVAGEFSNWKTLPLTKDDAGNWTFTKDFPPGRYQYKYVIDGGTRWEKDPAKPTGGDNSIIEVRAGAAAPAAGNVTFVFAALLRPNNPVVGTPPKRIQNAP